VRGSYVIFAMTTTTPFASLFASYRHNLHDHLHQASTDVTPHSATLLSAHLGLLTSIFGRPAPDTLPPDHDRRSAVGLASRSRGLERAANGKENGVSGCELRVELESRELWNKFDAYCTEMVITKSGR